jgi:poly(3-hydroxybutyrate) depolymerase
MVRAFIAFSCLCLASLSAAPLQPSQPKTGPGGSAYLHADLRESEHGAGGKRFWLFEPAMPSPKTAPLVIFLHGYSAMTPDPYRAWIKHIVRRGAIVVYPQYQKDLLTPPPEYLRNTAAAVRHALQVLAQEGRVAPDLSRVAVVGHSAGGVGSAGYAAIAVKEKLPVPLAIMPVHSGQGPENGWQVIPMEDLSTIPRSTRVVVVAGSDDKFVGTRSSRRIWEGSRHVAERWFITLQQDAHGWPRLSPGHLAPLAQDWLSTNAHDWYGYWRLFDELCETTFSALPFEPSPAMGKWSDGQPVKPLMIER